MGRDVYQAHSGDALVGRNYVEWKIQGFDTRPLQCVVSSYILDSPHGVGTAHYYVWMLVDGTPRIVAKPLIDQGADHQEFIGGPSASPAVP
ncbi:MAG: hypothetical protein AUI14_00885 [Actinobacteria bacterium 13_2_20CM_2_71_6]|nr:MAG: hypothetical protein AUI14_00885 [Actinobacteria bacterium 13_2_20CM_2_71_6]